ncbi:response regulator [Streptosporangium amethystogenes]|uniref:response regulator n=1 Tax=Streptosporangium amethystogenes TaxID=2002 RepID=UPI0004CA2541|nr:response regulator transcription factor [Streptosporangium amethystogenes]
MIRVLVADDQAMVRAGIAAMLSVEPDIEVVGQAADGAAATAQAITEVPDVVLMDIRMPGTDGLSATATITRRLPAVRVVMLTTFGLEKYVHTALRAGACGFLLKDAEPRRVIEVVRLTAAGQSFLDPAITSRLIKRLVPHLPSPAPALNTLTPREDDVLWHLTRGLTNAEIGAALGISATTVKEHVASVLAKLQVRDRLHATIYAYESGFIWSREP